MQYSPKLKKAMEEIKAVFDKYDIAGIAVIHTPGHGEYLFRINTTYSCARIENNHLKVNVKAEHFGGDKQLRDKFVTDTVNMFHVLATNTGRMAMQLMDASEHLDRATNAEHFGPGHSSHSAQNS